MTHSPLSVATKALNRVCKTFESDTHPWLCKQFLNTTKVSRQNTTEAAAITKQQAHHPSNPPPPLLHAASRSTALKDTLSTAHTAASPRSSAL